MGKLKTIAEREILLGSSDVPSPPRADPKVELRAVLNECRKVLDCHHRNTHRSLRDRITRCMERLGQCV